MSSQLTVTAKTGPAIQDTSIVLGNVTKISFDLVNRVVQVLQSTDTVIKQYDLVGVTTVTFSVSGANYTMVIS